MKTSYNAFIFDLLFISSARHSMNVMITTAVAIKSAIPTLTPTITKLADVSSTAPMYSKMWQIGYCLHTMLKHTLHQH